MWGRVKENPWEDKVFAAVLGPLQKGKDSPGQGTSRVIEQPGEAKACRIRYTFVSSEPWF